MPEDDNFHRTVQIMPGTVDMGTFEMTHEHSLKELTAYFLDIEDKPHGHVITTGVECAGKKYSLRITVKPL